MTTDLALFARGRDSGFEELLRPVLDLDLSANDLVTLSLFVEYEAGVEPVPRARMLLAIADAFERQGYGAWPNARHKPPVPATPAELLPDQPDGDTPPDSSGF